METIDVPDANRVSPVRETMQGYDEATVDDFLRAVADAKAQLRARIEDAEARTTRARTLLGMHEAMVSTMHDAYQEVTAKRRAAEATAATIMQDAQRRAEEVRRGSGDDIFGECTQ